MNYLERLKRIAILSEEATAKVKQLERDISDLFTDQELDVKDAQEAGEDAWKEWMSGSPLQLEPDEHAMKPAFDAGWEACEAEQLKQVEAVEVKMDARSGISDGCPQCKGSTDDGHYYAKEDICAVAELDAQVRNCPDSLNFTNGQ